MSPLTDIETNFVTVPAGAKRVGSDLHLAARVLVEWRLPEGTVAPEWLKGWTRSSGVIGVRLENDGGTVVAQGTNVNEAIDSRISFDPTVGRRKAGAPEREGSSRI